MTKPIQKSSFQMRRKQSLWLGIVLIGIFWCTRLIGIQVFPPFLDEMQHVHEAEQAFLGHPLAFVGEGRLFSIWWLTLFQPYQAETVLVMRSAALLAVLVGFAAILGIGRLAAGLWGTVFAGLLYLFSGYHTFFERLALADPISGSAVSVGLYFAFRLSRRMNYRDAVLTGVALFIAIGGKATTLPYLGIPIAAGITLWPAKRTRQENTRWVIVAMGTSIGLVGFKRRPTRLNSYPEQCGKDGGFVVGLFRHRLCYTAAGDGADSLASQSILSHLPAGSSSSVMD
jgi:hypothetical protein